jgi:hypothetical protein
LGVLEILKDMGEKLNPGADTSALDGYIKQRLLDALQKKPEVKPELVHGSSCLEKLSVCRCITYRAPREIIG